MRCRVDAAGERRLIVAFGRWVDVATVHADGGRPDEPSPLRMIEVRHLDEHDAGRDMDPVGNHPDQVDRRILVWTLLGDQDLDDYHTRWYRRRGVLDLARHEHVITATAAHLAGGRQSHTSLDPTPR